MTGLRQRKQNLLTSRKVETAKEPSRYSDGNGLYLVVRSGGSKQWTFLYRRNGKLREMGLGSPSRGVGLVTARELRDEARRTIARGIDPLDARRQAKRSAARIPTFGAYALALLDRIRRGIFEHQASSAMAQNGRVLLSDQSGIFRLIGWTPQAFSLV